MPRTVYVCPDCGCRDIQMTAWVYVNTGVQTQDEPPDDDYYCPVCEDHFSLAAEVEEDDFEHALDCDMGLDCLCGVASD